MTQHTWKDASTLVRLASLVISSALIGLGADVQVPINKVSGTVVDRGIVIPAGKFNKGYVERLARDFVTEMAGKRIARLTMATSLDDLSMALVKGHRRPNFDNSMEYIKTMKLPRVPVAQVLMVNGAARLSYRDGGGLSEYMIAGDTNPALFTGGKMRFEIVGLFLTEPGPAAIRPDFDLTVFLRASPTVSISAGVDVTRKIWGLAGVSLLNIEVRGDAFFLEASEFPAISPFEKEQRLPSQLYFLTAPHFGCSISEQHGVQCSGVSFRP
jgi:hypothetical protein